jgi:CRP-like cAMP-binding protein
MSSGCAALHGCNGRHAIFGRKAAYLMVHFAHPPVALGALGAVDSFARSRAVATYRQARTSVRKVTCSPTQNHLLAQLPSAEQRRWFPKLELTDMPLGAVMYEAGATMTHVYFPSTSIVSLLYVMANGASAEIAVVGNEGFVGVSLYMGGGSTSSRGVVQSAGKAYRLAAQLMNDEFERSRPVQHLLLRYTQALITQLEGMPHFFPTNVGALHAADKAPEHIASFLRGKEPRRTLAETT